MGISNRLVSQITNGLALAAVGLLMVAPAAQAEDVVVRLPRRSGVEMPQDHSAAYTFDVGIKQDKRKGGQEGPPTLPALPGCDQSNARRKEVFHFSPASAFFEALYYDSSDPAQASAARSYPGRSIAYVGQKPLSQVHPLLSFASTLKLRCLPTLFHYPMEGGRRFSEYLEGPDAWKVVPGKKAAAPAQSTPQTTARPAPVRRTRSSDGSTRF